MNTLRLIMSLSLLICSLLGNSYAFENVDHISPEQAMALIEQYQDSDGLVLIDVRMDYEFEEERIAGAINIDFLSPTFGATVDKFNRDWEYIVYCRSGSRGGGALQEMKKMGFTRVHNLSGGITAWEKADYPVEW